MNLTPKKLFLMDGIGACISAIMLGIVLVQLQKYIGMPTNVLYLLAIIPVFFAIYSFTSYLKAGKNASSLLKGIAIANLCYCILSIYFMIKHMEVLTSLGWTYFILEILIVVSLVGIELKVARKYS